MMYVILTTIIATILTIYFSYNKYKKEVWTLAILRSSACVKVSHLLD